MDKIVKLFAHAVPFIKQVNFSDPLIMVLMSFYLTVVVLFVVFKNRPALVLLELLGLLFIVTKTRDIHIFLSMRQPQLLKDKYITLRYFDDEGKFCVFMIGLPIFIISMAAGISLAVKLFIQIIKGSKELKQQRKAEEKTETEATKNE